MIGKAGAFQGILNLIKRNPDVIKEAGISAALTTGIGALTGDIPGALKHGAADFALSYPATLAVRALRPKPSRRVIDAETGKVTEQPGRSSLEVPVHIGASVLSGVAVSSLESHAQSGQQQQVAQQIEQRSLVNQLPLQEQLLSPGTQFQMAGLSPGADFQKLLNQRGNWTQYLSPADQALVQQTLGV